MRPKASGQSLAGASADGLRERALWARTAGMPWEAKRWFVFAGLMFAGSIWALRYEPDNVQRRSIVDVEGEGPGDGQREREEDRPTVPLRRPGPGETPEPSTTAQAVPSAAVAAGAKQTDAGTQP